MNEIEFYEACRERFSDLMRNIFQNGWLNCIDAGVEFFTPEHILFYICSETEVKNYCKSIGSNPKEMKAEVDRYLSTMERMPEDIDYETLPSSASIEMLRLLFDRKIIDDGINLKFAANKSIPGKRVQAAVPDVLRAMCAISDSMCQYIIMKYMGEPSEWFYALVNEYEEDIDGCWPLSETVEHTKDIRNETLAFMSIDDDEDDIEYDDIIDPDNIFDRLMKSAGTMMDALNAINSGTMTEGGPEMNNSGQTRREPWEDLVTDISATYMNHNPLIGREDELSRTIRILCRKDKNNVLYQGEAGVGKTAIIYGLARLIAEQKAPQWMLDKHIYGLDMGAMVAGSSFHGEFEKRMKAVLEGASRRANCIIYIDEMHTLMGSNNGNGAVSAADILKPYLEDGRVRFIGCTTYQDYNRSIAKDKAIVRRFRQVDIKEPTAEETIEIINGLLPTYEKHHGVRYAAEAVRYAVEQSDRLIHDRFLPDKAIDIIDEAGAWLQQNPLLNKQGKPKAERFQTVTTDIIKTILTDLCRIDAKALTGEDNTILKDLAPRIAKEIYGQDEAISQVTQAIMMSKAGLNEPGKPIASLLFVGPTGVGKTEVCRVLAREMGIELVRFDMSEYTEKHTISKLIGSPAGYVGYEEGGLLTDAIRKTPNCVLLLDEIEKAHADIYNILLQVMDYARLTDNKGNKADFSNVILVMTSNAGAQQASTQAAIGFANSTSKGQAMMSTVKKTFKPEFLNRLSATVIFNDMDRHMASLIFDKKISQLAKRLDSKGVTLTLTTEAREWLIERGYSLQYGAREMDRAISQHLTPLLMHEILFGSLTGGGQASIMLSAGSLTISC